MKIIKRQRQRLIIDLAFENCNLFKDQYGRGYALAKINNHTETIFLDSNTFKCYLTKLFYEKFQKIPSRENISNVIQFLQSKAKFESPTIALHIKISFVKR